MAPPPAPVGPVAELQPSSPPPKRPGRWAVALVVVVAVVAAATIIAANHGTSKSATPPAPSRSPRAVLVAAAAHTRAAGTAHVSSGETLIENGTSIDLISIDGDASFTTKASAMTLSMRGATVEQMRSVNGVQYVAAPDVALPDGKHWLSLRPADLGLGGVASTFASNDPSSGLGYLSAITGTPHAVGPATIDGVATTHYTFTIDLKAFTDKLGQASSKAGAALGLGTLNGLLDLTKIPAQAWIDHEGRVRELQITLAASELGESIKAGDTTKFSHFDAPVSVSAPPASDTVPFSSFPQFFQKLGSAIGSPGITT
jgi:hypothetical protein